MNSFFCPGRAGWAYAISSGRSGYRPLNGVGRNLTFSQKLVLFSAKQSFFLNCYSPECLGFQPCNLVLTGTDALAAAPPKVEAFPNPTSGQLQIDAEVPLETVELLDLQGRRVCEGATPSPPDLSHLPRGVYVLRIRAAGQLIHKKIIRQ